MKLSLIPLLGPFHLRYPAYNAVTVCELLAAVQPQALAITALAARELERPSWQDTSELALPLSIIPWAKKRRLPIYPVFEPSPDPSAPADFRRYASDYSQLRDKQAQLDRMLKTLEALLEQTLSLKRIQAEVIPLLHEYQILREALFEDGPASDWLRQRCKIMAQRILELPHQQVAVLASVEHLPLLTEALSDADMLELPLIGATEASRERSLLDFAFRLDVPEPGNLLASLRKLPAAEARYHEANVLLANGHLAEALELLESASQGDFSEPYYLPGYLLARLGQVYDLVGKRDAAIRSYRGVLALSYAPQEAREAAEQGLEQAFAGEEGKVSSQ